MGIPQSQQTAWLALHFVKNAALSFSNWRVVLRTLGMCHRLASASCRSWTGVGGMRCCHHGYVCSMAPWLVGVRPLVFALFRLLCR